MNRLTLMLFFFLTSLLVYSQDQIKIDSLQIQLNTSIDDTSKVKTLLQLSDIFNHTDLLKAFEYAKEALEISKDINEQKYIIRSHRALATCLISFGNYDEALNYLMSGLKIAQKNVFIEEELVMLGNIGIIHDRIGEFDVALKYYFEALNIYNKNTEQGNQLLKIRSSHVLFNNIGNIYLSKNDLSTAEDYYLKGLLIAEQRQDNLNIGVMCNNLGKLETQRGNFPKAYDYLIKSLKAREKINDKSGIAKSYYHLSSYYQSIEDYDEALHYAQNALILGTELGEPLTSKISSMFLYQINKKLGRFEKALEFHETYKLLSDSLINDSKIQEITKIQLQFDYEKTEKERLAKQLRLKYIYFISLAIVLLGLVIVVLLFVLSKNRQKRIQLENDKLEKEIELRNKELATNVMYLVKKNEFLISISDRLLKIKSKLKEENKEPIQKIIFDLQVSMDKEIWEEFELRFQNVHKEFYENLKRDYSDLSPSEIKLAAFLRLNMTTKEISALTGQSINTLETARYRLRKKLGITNQEVNLVNFLLNI